MERSPHTHTRSGPTAFLRERERHRPRPDAPPRRRGPSARVLLPLRTAGKEEEEEMREEEAAAIGNAEARPHGGDGAPSPQPPPPFCLRLRDEAARGGRAARGKWPRPERGLPRAAPRGGWHTGCEAVARGWPPSRPRCGASGPGAGRCSALPLPSETLGVPSTRCCRLPVVKSGVRDPWPSSGAPKFNVKRIPQPTQELCQGMATAAVPNPVVLLSEYCPPSSDEFIASRFLRFLSVPLRAAVKISEAVF